jgi:hypothetical protein
VHFLPQFFDCFFLYFSSCFCKFFWLSLFFNFISDMKTLAFFRGSLYIVLFVN